MSPDGAVEIPAEARQQTPESAVAFVKFYFDQVNTAWMTPDEQRLAAVADATCQSCNNLQAHAVALVQKKQKATAPPLAVSSAASQEGAPAGQQFVTIQLEQLGVTTIDAAGVVVDTDPKQSLKREVVVIWRGGQWWLYGISA